MTRIPESAGRSVMATVVMLAATAGAIGGPTREELLATESAKVSILTLEPDSETEMHTHLAAHVAVTLTEGRLIHVAADGSESIYPLPEDLMGYFEPGGPAHALRNAGATPYRVVVIDLLAPQTGARNRCAAMLPGRPLDCAEPEAGARGGCLVPQMETDQVMVSLLKLPPGGEQSFEGVAMAPVVVALAGVEAIATFEAMATVDRELPGAPGRGEKPLAPGDAASTLAQTPLKIRNTGTVPARFLVVEFK